jgi:hypothetical protein
MADEDLKAELERLKAENESLKSQRGRSISLKVSEKGGLSVYGLGRFPVTLYKEQWTKLLGMADEIRAFLKEHERRLNALVLAAWCRRFGRRQEKRLVAQLAREPRVTLTPGLEPDRDGAEQMRLVR